MDNNFMLTETQEFMKWFGNSKIVDENGKPMVLYHATSENFSLFDTASFKSHFGTLDQAEARVAELSSMGINKQNGYDVKIMSVYLNIRNPFRMNDLADNWKSPSALSREIENTLCLPSGSTHGEFDAIYHKTKSDAKTIVQMLKNRGYDGIVYKNEFEGVVDPSQFGKGGIVPTGKHSGDSYIPFDPAQIKSAVCSALK